MKMVRRKAKVINIGNLSIGGDNPVAIQSMTKTKTCDVERTVRQIRDLERIGCQIVRVAVRDNVDAQALKKIKAGIRIPLVADIHFDWRLAIQAIDNGVDKIRLNPGNIYKLKHIREIVSAAKRNHIPIRVGVNAGSLRRTTSLSAKKNSLAETMVRSALDYINILEKEGFYDIVISLKASNIFDTIDAYKRIAKLCDYPLHLGVTATGPLLDGIVRSSLATGHLLLNGIGDTVRVSLTASPQQEVRAAQIILDSLGLTNSGVQIISCPTCGRCEVDLVGLVNRLENQLSAISYQLSDKPIKLAIMGCVVNGPGEAREADIGIAFGKKDGLLFKKGKPLRKIPFSQCIEALKKEILI